MASKGLFGSSLVKKYWMALTGLFLITFLVVHATVNAMIFWNDGGVTFNMVAHFFGSNILIRTMEIGLFLGLIAHVVDGLMLWSENRAARPVKYAMEKGSANRSWYSASMGILGTLILLFLILHLWHFWVKSRGIVGSLDELAPDADGQENLFLLMVETFRNPIPRKDLLSALISLNCDFATTPRTEQELPDPVSKVVDITLDHQLSTTTHDFHSGPGVECNHWRPIGQCLRDWRPDLVVACASLWSRDYSLPSDRDSPDVLSVKCHGLFSRLGEALGHAAQGHA